jgi:hypothetical protein
MAGHTITPYEITATRKFVRDRTKRAELLLLASLSNQATVDVLDVVAAHIEHVEPMTSTDKTKTTRCVLVRRHGDRVEMVFACDVSGEREVVIDGADPGRPVVFMKGAEHVARFLSCCVLWRPSGGTDGVLLLHSPWGRGGSKSHVINLLQRALDKEPLAKAKLHADPKVPVEELERLIRDANATKITYTKRTGITSDFVGNGTTPNTASAPAEIDVVVRGSDGTPFLDAFKKALTRKADRNKLLTVKVADGDGGYEEQVFDDAEVELRSSAGTRTYSIKRDTIPTIGFNLTSEINSVYYALPDDAHGRWPTELLDGIAKHLRQLLDHVKD